MNIPTKSIWKLLAIVAAVPPLLACIAAPVRAQRALGADISYWNRGSSSGSSDGISQANWNTAFASGRVFVQVRSSRGGTTGTDASSGTPGNPGTPSTLSERYDDPDFARNITRAANAGMIAGSYHFGRPGIAGNTGTDEANHYLEAASAWMRPGYLMPMYDLEENAASANALAQFAVDFSNQIYNTMRIRPMMYINGNYSNILSGASQSLRDQLAKPATLTPSMVGPAYPVLFDARYSGSPQVDPNTIPIQTGNPKDVPSTLSTMYGPWDDYGNSSPWALWQYSSIVSMPGFNAVDSGVDGDVSHGDIEYVKDMMVPAVWWNNSSGDWGTMTNWNSGQPLGSHASGNPAPTAPYTAPGQYAAVSGGVLPVPRLPGTAGSGPTITSGVNDTVILERPSANITVTLSTGTFNIRKLYMRETLNLTGGSLTINYDPLYNFNVGVADSLRSGAISAQFSGAVSMSGSAALTVPALQVDASQTFTLAGGTLTFNKISLLSNATILVSGDVTMNPWNTSNARYTSHTATITGASASVDLGGGTRIFTIGNLADDVDVDVSAPITNGGLTKNGAGTMRLSGANTFSGPVTINAGVLRSNNAAGFSSSSAITVNGGTLEMNGVTDTVASLAGTGGAVTQGAAGLTLGATSGSTTFAGTVTGTGTFTKNGAATEILSGSNSLGPVVINAGSLLFNGANTTGPVTVNGGTLGGTGSVSGIVTVGPGGHLAPGASIESLAIGGLTLNPSSVLDFELGPGGAQDLLSISGLLTLNGGSLRLIDAGGMGAGIYPLIFYGSRSGNVSVLGTPTGPTSFNYSLLDTGSSINLLVSAVPEPGCAALIAMGLFALRLAIRRRS
jgi:autotransporter-associated beta strand protein